MKQNHPPRNLQRRDTILRFMLDYESAEGRQPSVREISKAAEISSLSTTAGYLHRMVNEGLLSQDGLYGRIYRVSEKARTQLMSA